MLLYKDIIKEEDPRLKQKSEEISIPLLDEDIETLELMNEYLINGYDEDLAQKYGIRPGVGLAAPQLGILKKMFVILAYDETGNIHHYGVINPRIVSHSEELTYLDTGEGCLSVDRAISGYILRPRRIKVDTHLYDFNTKELTKTTLRLKNYMAIVFQHEYDHLNGVLFFDRINKDNPFFVPNGTSPINFEQEE